MGLLGGCWHLCGYLLYIGTSALTRGGTGSRLQGAGAIPVLHKQIIKL